MTQALGLASLFMYDMPEFWSANESWWHGLARAMTAEGIEAVPAHLSEVSHPMAHWVRPELLFSQTCGYPLTHGLRGKVTVIATPAYDCYGCVGAEYCSLILVRDEDSSQGMSDLAGRTAVVNSFDSQSGFSSLRSAVAPFARDGRFFDRIETSGGHLASMAAVQAGRGDVCAIDAVTYALAARYRPGALDGLRILERGPEAPGLPYITAGGVSAEKLRRLRAAVFTAMEDPDLASTREALLIAGAEVLPQEAYVRILDLENAALERLPEMNGAIS